MAARIVWRKDCGIVVAAVEGEEVSLDLLDAALPPPRGRRAATARGEDGRVIGGRGRHSWVDVDGWSERMRRMERKEIIVVGGVLVVGWLPWRDDGRGRIEENE